MLNSVRSLKVSGSVLAIACLSTGALGAEGWKANPATCKQLFEKGWTRGATYYEDKVPAYALPDPLVCSDGSKVETAKQWREKRRPEILELFKQHMYGRAPVGRPKEMTFEVLDRDDEALGGKATRKQVHVSFTGLKEGPGMDLLLYLPKKRKGPVPLFIGLNFNGNQSISKDPGIKLGTIWPRRGRKKPAIADEKSRGSTRNRWPVEMILKRGYGLATIYYGDIDPDFHDGYKNGVHGAFDKDRQKDSWSSIRAWAWGLSRAMDYLETDGDVDAKRVAVLGHSRLGKTALLAGATDERFAVVISNNSGCGGAALTRRLYGETLKRMNRSFPHWLCDNFNAFKDNEAAVPVDQHMLIALMAPRPVYVASADQDLWADPRGEFLSCKHATPVYHLLKLKGLEAEAMPPLETPIQKGRIGYHVRKGKHDVLPYDWKQYMNFADKFL